MYKIIVCKINIDIDVESQPVMSASDFMPWFIDFIDDVKRKADEIGYHVPQTDPAPHRINGGISKYYVFSLFEDECKLKVIVEIRFSNHNSHLSEAKHEAITREENDIPSDTPIGYIDVVQPSDVAYVHIDVDGTVVRDEEVALQIIERKLLAIKNKER